MYEANYKYRSTRQVKSAATHVGKVKAIANIRFKGKCDCKFRFPTRRFLCDALKDLFNHYRALGRMLDETMDEATEDRNVFF
jgi:hypothetical protein